MIRKRRKGVAIVDTKKGILVVAGKSKKFTLPGGGAEKNESRKNAAIRELFEETNLKVKNIKFLFNYVGHGWHTLSGILVMNYAKVFLVKARGIPKPCNEIKYISFWKPGSKLHLSENTIKVIEKYLAMKK